MNGFNFTTDGIKGVRKALDARLADLGGAKSKEMRTMGNAVAKAIRKTLSIQGGGTLGSGVHGPDRGGHASRPGEPPRKQTGQLSKSVKVGVVGTGLRIGVLRFTSAMLEEGVNTAEPARTSRRTGRKRARTKRVKGVLRIAPRPFMDRAVALAQPDMIDGFKLTFERERLGA